MGRLVCGIMGVSLDGYVEDARGNFDWCAPSEEVHAIANEHVRAASALLFGRRMYEELDEFWTAAAERDDLPPIEAEFAQIYVETPRIVFSDSLETVPDGVRLVRSADARAEIERLRQEPGGHLEIAGPALAASMVDLIDEFRMWLCPVVVGGGKPYWPAPPEQLNLRLAENRTCEGGVLYLRYERAAA
jgi:dihydrofolate reductase